MSINKLNAILLQSIPYGLQGIYDLYINRQIALVKYYKGIQSLGKKQLRSTSMFRSAGCNVSKLYNYLVSFCDTTF